MPREPAPAQQGTPLPLHCLDQVEIVATWGLSFSANQIWSRRNISLFSRFVSWVANISCALFGLPHPVYKRVDDRPGQVEYLESPFGFYVFGIEDF